MDLLFPNRLSASGRFGTSLGFFTWNKFSGEFKNNATSRFWADTRNFRKRFIILLIDILSHFVWIKYRKYSQCDSWLDTRNAHHDFKNFAFIGRTEPIQHWIIITNQYLCLDSYLLAGAKH